MIWLFGEIWAWILAGFLLGLLVGWWIWSQTAPAPAPDVEPCAVASLHAELALCASALARAQSDLAAANRLSKALETSFPAAGASVTPLFLSAPNGQCDDLTRISGIAPRLATLLADIGILHIWQIAGWSPDDIAQVDAKLGAFSGHIVRDKWVEQANALM